MKVCITQPGYIPGLTRFGMMLRCDKYVFYDDVPLSRQSWETFNYIRGSDGKPLKRSVSIQHKKNEKILLNQVKICYNGWDKEHVQSIKSNYTLRYSSPCLTILERWFAHKPERLTELTVGLTKDLANLIGCTPPQGWAKSSDYGVKWEPGHRPERLIALCQKLGADEYMANEGSVYLKDYEGMFREVGIKLSFFEYRPKPYPVLKPPYLEGLSVVDLLMNVSNPLDYIREGLT